MLNAQARSTSPRSTARVLLLALAALVMSTLAAAPSATAAPTRLTDFQRSGRYLLYANGQPLPAAHVYFSKSTGAYLVEASVFPTPVLVFPRTGCVEAVAPNERVARTDGGVDLVLAALPCRHGRFRVEGPDILFRVGDVPARLKPKPPILGSRWAEDVLDHSPEYGRAAKLYQPDAATLQRLAAAKTPVRVVVFFGTWCGTCTRLIPKILRVEQELKKLGAVVTFDYWGLPPMPGFQNDPQVRRMHISKIPAGFLYAGEKNIGRLESTEWERPEVALSRFVQ